MLSGSIFIRETDMFQIMQIISDITSQEACVTWQTACLARQNWSLSNFLKSEIIVS